MKSAYGRLAEASAVLAATIFFIDCCFFCFVAYPHLLR